MPFSLSSRLWQVRLFAVTLLASLGTALFGQLNQPSATDGFDPNANGVVNVALAQRDGKVLLGGAFTTLRPNGAPDNVDRNYLARVNADGTLDADFNPNANAQVFALGVQSTGKIIVGGSFTSVDGVTRNRLARLNPDGKVDPTFNVDLGGGFAPEVYALLVLPDDRIVIGGAFTTVGGVTRNRIARLSSSGALDLSYDPNAGAAVLSLARQNDGKIILGGSFTTLQPAGDTAATTRRYLARLNLDGKPDSQFDPKPDNTVHAIAVQTDGAILIGGNFSNLQPIGKDAAVGRSRIARLAPDGSLDDFYSPNANGLVATIVLQPDGRALLAGSFTILLPNGGAAANRSYVARLNVDGSADANFQVQANGPMRALALQGDGRIVIGGEFTQLRGSAAGVAVTRNRVARLNADGTPDTTLDPAASGLVLVQAAQKDDKIVVGGSFTIMGGLTRNYLARLNADGTVDTTFNPLINAPVLSVAIDADQKILIGGPFTNVNGTKRSYLARLNSNGTLDESFNPSPNNQVLAIALQNDSKIVLGGLFTTLSPDGGALTFRNHIARLTSAGAVDTGFDPNADAAPSVITIQPADQKILLGGSFTTFTPNAGAQVRRQYSARLNTDGTVDTSFYPLPNSSVLAQLIQADGKIVIAGNFNALAPNQGAVVVRYYIARLNKDSTIDTTFNPRAGSTVAALALQNDKIIAGGLFGFFRPGDDLAKNIDRSRIARINIADGMIDPTYDPAAGGQVSTLLLLASGKLLVGGGFTSMKPANQGFILTPNRIARLNADGSVDTAFDPGLTTKNGGSVEVLALQPDGRLIVGGAFNNFGGSGSSNLARFTASGDADVAFLPNASGPVSTVLVQPSRLSTPQANVFAWFNRNSTLRTAFNAAAAQLTGQVNAILVQPDGKVILGGSFTNRNGVALGNYLVRVKLDGTFDDTFNPRVAGTVNAIARQSDGKLVIGGAFDSVAGLKRYRIARLDANGVVDPAYDPYASDTVYALAMQSDDQVIVGGAFTTFQPNGATTTTARNYIARFSKDGVLDTGYNPTPSAAVRALAIQPDGLLVVGGEFVSFQPNGSATVTGRTYIARLKINGDLDSDFNPTANAIVYAIALQPSDNKPIIGGSFSVLQPSNGGTFVRRYVARLNTNGSVDSNFDPSPNNIVRALAVTADGSVLLGGSFTALQPGSAFNPVGRNRVALVGSDGALDTSFNPGPAGDVLALATAGDGSVLVGGSFTSLAADANLIVGGAFATIGGAPVANLAQLDSGGSAVPTFAPNPNGAVLALLQQADSKLIVGGAFTHIVLPRNRLARLTTDGALDAAFNPNVEGGAVSALALLPSGKILVGGAFTSVGSVARSGLARVNSDGSLDPAFTAVAAGGQVNALLVRADGKIVVAGAFTTLAGQPRNRLARLNEDGSIDASFNPNVNGEVFALVLSTDGKLTIGGKFTSVGGAGRNNIARFNADGSLDTTFDPGADAAVQALALQAEGAPVLGGLFSTITGQPRYRLARLAAATTVATQKISASADRATLTWTRTGGGPELSAVRFETSADAITWMPLSGTATRVSAGSSNWRLTGLTTLPASDTFYVRALGSSPTSKNASAGLVRSEQVFNFAQTPVLSTGAIVGASTDQNFRYATSDGKAAAYSAAGLPAGLSIDAATGIITGTPTETGTFDVTISAANAGGNVSASLLVSVGTTASGSAGQSIRLVNLSARSQVGANGTAITGFVSSGGSVLIRAVGPGLTGFGVAGALADPMLRVYNSAGAVVNSNDNWTSADLTPATIAATGAFPFVAGSKDAALVLNLPAGGYTAQVTDNTGRGGVVLTEVYDANGATVAPRFSNLSTRAPVAPGSPLVGGFVITAASGTATQRVLIRGVGPGIAKFGVANVLADPVLKVYDTTGSLIATSDNWNATDGTAAAAASSGAFALDVGSKDAALLLTLAPGGYTFEITAAPGSAAGEALADIYAAP